MKIFSVQLPFPPSSNTYYRAISRGGFCQNIISKKGRKYKEDVENHFNYLNHHDMMLSEMPIANTARLIVSINLHPPDKRRRDLDNYLKALLDSCTGFIWKDDEQIDRLILERKEVVKGGMVEMTIEVR